MRRGPGSAARQDGDPAEPRPARPRAEGDAALPRPDIVQRYYVPLIYTACRTCYSELEPQEIFRRAVDGEVATGIDAEAHRSVIESGHGSTIEHIVFTFAISGVSRTLSHQLVRHRAGVAFDQQSQRYVKYKGASTMLPATIAEGDPACASATRSRSTARSGCTASSSRRASRARTRGSSSPTRRGRTSS